jgi:nitrile hydratase beta subunit
MNGAHDLGGMHGFGPVEIEKDEPVFHHPWEARTFALNMAAGFLGKWNIDIGRHAREQMPPAEYLATTYYEHWLFGLEKLLADFGMIRPGEIERRQRDPAASAAPPPPGRRVLQAKDVEAAMRKRRTSKADENVPPRFRVGDHVRTKNIHPVGHTRLPRYARGKGGMIVLDHGVWVFPDTSGNGLGRNPQHCYSVRFTARELWGEAAAARDTIHLDLWDDHLEPA